MALMGKKTGAVDAEKFLRLKKYSEVLAVVGENLSNPERAKRWDTLRIFLKDNVSKLGENVDISKMTPADFKEIYEKAQNLEKEFDKLNSAQKKVMMAKSKFRQTTRAIGFKAFDFTQAEYNFLKEQFPNDFVTGVTVKEFTTDHALVVLLPAAIGNRANLSMPAELVAMWGSPFWTNIEHLYEVIMNTEAHLTKAGASNMLIYQKLVMAVEKDLSIDL